MRVSAVFVALWWRAAWAEIDCESTCLVSRNSMEHQKRQACSKESKTLPRPKVGLACTHGFGAGFDDACVTTCRGDSARRDQGVACKQYRNELPKPTTMRSCGAGYQKGFDHGVKEATAIVDSAATTTPAADEPVPETPKAAQPEAPSRKAAEKSPKTAVSKDPEPAAAEPEPAAAEPEPAAAEQPPATEPRLLFQMPVTLDEKEVALKIYEGDDPEEVVATFCAEHMASAGDSCMRQLLPHVTKKLEEAADATE